MRVLKGPDPKSYIVVIKFISTEAATNFMNEFHMRKFNEIESEACNVVWLKSIHIEDNGPQTSPEQLFKDHLNQENCPVCIEPNITSHSDKSTGS